jgi:putative DNA-invertase from lambdoid prophage Rac
MTMSVLIAVAEFERRLMIECTRPGIASACAHARAEGKVMDPTCALTDAQCAKALHRLAADEPVARFTRDYRTARQSFMRVRQSAASA